MQHGAAAEEVTSATYWKDVEEMSWKILNTILGLATVDEEFCRALLANPLAAVQARQFTLTPEEQAIFQSISATTLAEFSQQLVARFQPDQDNLSSSGE